MVLQDNLNYHLETSLNAETLYRNVGPLSVPFESRYQLKKIPGDHAARNVGDSSPQNSIIHSSFETYLNQAYSDPRQRNAWHGLTIGLSGIGAKDKFNKSPPPLTPLSLAKDYKKSKSKLANNQQGPHFPEKDLSSQVSWEKKRSLERVLIRDMLWIARGSKERNPFIVQLPPFHELENSVASENQSNVFAAERREGPVLTEENENQLMDKLNISEKYEKIMSEKKRQLQKIDLDDKDDNLILDAEFDRLRQLMKFPFQNASLIGFPTVKQRLRKINDEKFLWRQPRGQCSCKRSKPSEFYIGVHCPETVLTDRYNYTSDEFQALIDRVVGKNWNKEKYGEYDIQRALMKWPKPLTSSSERKIHCVQWYEDWVWRQPRPICSNLDLMVSPQLLALPYYKKLLAELKRANNEEEEEPTIKRAFLDSGKHDSRRYSLPAAFLFNPASENQQLTLKTCDATPLLSAVLESQMHSRSEPQMSKSIRGLIASPLEEEIYERHRKQGGEISKEGELPEPRKVDGTSELERESDTGSQREEALEGHKMDRDGGPGSQAVSERSKRGSQRLSGASKPERESDTGSQREEALGGHKMDRDGGPGSQAVSERSKRGSQRLSGASKPERESDTGSQREEASRDQRMDRVRRSKSDDTFEQPGGRLRELAGTDQPERKSVTSPRREKAARGHGKDKKEKLEALENLMRTHNKKEFRNKPAPTRVSNLANKTKGRGRKIEAPQKPARKCSLTKIILNRSQYFPRLGPRLFCLRENTMSDEDPNKLTVEICPCHHPGQFATRSHTREYGETVQTTQ